MVESEGQINLINAKILQFLETQDTSKYCDALQLSVYHKGRKKAEVKTGKSYKYFDIASLTKVVFTTTAFMRLVDKNPRLYRAKIGPLFADSFLFSQKASWTHLKLFQLLNHTAGFTWWQPLKKKVPLSGPWRQRRLQLSAYFNDIRLNNLGKCVYSDLDMIFMGYVLEELYNKNLLEIWKQHARSLKMPHTHFQVDNMRKYSRNQYAPTLAFQDKSFAGQGLVNDVNARNLGGVSSNAGLFSTLKDLSHWGLLWRKALKGGRGLCSQKTALKFARRTLPRKRGDWATGFMLPTRGSASCGKYFSTSSTGHTGFTGPSIWFDNKRDLLVVVLANRKHPLHRKYDFSDWRPRLHNAIVESL